MSFRSIALAAAAVVFLAAPAVAAGPDGVYSRPNGTTAKVTTCGGNLCAKVQESGFDMFMTGIAPAGEGKWKGDMKHPDMPGFMTFNGTVTTTPGGLKIQGCAVGQSMCDSENWTRK